MIDVSSEQAWNRRCASKGNVDTSVVFACQAWLAFVADDVGLDRDSVSDGMSCDGWMFGNHDT